MPAIAIKAYKAGDLVIECKPLVHSVESGFKGKNCDNCLNECHSLKKCSKCHQMYYCGKDCQTNDWKYHKNECRIYRNSVFPMCYMPSIERLLLRLWLCITSDPTFATKKYPNVIGSDVSLNDIEVDLLKVRQNPILMINFNGVNQHFTQLRVDFDHKELFRWFGLTSKEGSVLPLHHSKASIADLVYYHFNTDAVAYGLFIELLNISHSCIPNTCQVMNGLTYQLRAVRDIQVGQSLSMNVISLLFSRSQRQSQLKMDLNIDCDCDKCRLNLDKDVDYVQCHQLLADFRTHCKNIGTDLMPYKNCCDFTISNRLLKMLDKIYGKYYPYVSEIYLIYLIRLAKCAKRPDKQVVKDWALRVKERLSVTHGSDHPIYGVFKSVSKDII